VRLVSRGFNDLALPVAYRYLTLNKALVESGARTRYPAAFRYIETHTQHIIATSDLDPIGVTAVLWQVKRLQSIRWCYVYRELCAKGMWLPSEILAPHLPRFPKAKLFVENLPLNDNRRQTHQGYTEAIPAELLVSLKLANPAPPLTTKLTSLKRLLVSSTRLETLHYKDRGQGTSFKFDADECMPPVMDLSLKSYDWNHTAEEVARHWNISQLQSLELVSVPIWNFLVSVDPLALRNLRHLRCEDFSAHLPDRRKEATGLLSNLVQKHIVALRSLHLICHVEKLSLGAILLHGPTMQSLTLRDHVDFFHDDRQCPTLRAGQITALARGLPHVRTLELDLDVAVCDDVERFIAALASFPALETLVLHTQTTIRPPVDAPYDPIHLRYLDTRSVADMAQSLIAIKRKMNPSFLPEWKSITIMVGGWRRGGILRRHSEAWKYLNAFNVYAERCFVVDRLKPHQHDPTTYATMIEIWDFGQGMTMKEEMPMIPSFDNYPGRYTGGGFTLL
jgi:hypothetical protein